MPRLTGTVTIFDQLRKEERVIKGAQFSLEEDDNRHLGEGVYQRESLLVYKEDHFEIYVEVVDGEIVNVQVRGQASLLEDNLEVC